MKSQPHAIGTTYKTRGKHPKTCTVTDILRTYNNAGECVQVRYIATHDFLGQVVTDRDVIHTTIAMGLISRPSETAPAIL
jgi:hypothetical protein